MKRKLFTAWGREYTALDQALRAVEHDIKRAYFMNDEAEAKRLMSIAETLRGSQPEPKLMPRQPFQSRCVIVPKCDAQVPVDLDELQE